MDRIGRRWLGVGLVRAAARLLDARAVSGAESDMLAVDWCAGTAGIGADPERDGAW
jgi:hypothetical protein